MQTKIIAVDLDGTLLNSDGNISSENLNAIKQLSKSGIIISTLTGRTFYEIPAEIRNCEDVKYFVYSNGAGINHIDKGVIRYNNIPNALAVEIYNVLKSYTCFVEIYSNGHPYVCKDKLNNEMLKYYNIDNDFIPTMLKTRVPINDIEELLFDDTYKIEMFDIFFKYEDERKHFASLISKKTDDIQITTSMSNNLEITLNGVDKGFGLKQLCKILNSSVDEAVVIGDSKNDISAFKISGKKYAVSNACLELKQLADKTICSNDEDIMVYMAKELL